MKVYLVVLQDRHIDIEITVYNDLQKALSVAKQIVEDHGYSHNEPPIELDDELLFSEYLSGEGDHVTVLLKEIQ